MVKGALWKKAFRDMQKSKAQFISILIMAALAMSIVTGLDSIWLTIRNHADNMYQAADLADLWVNVANPSEKVLSSIRRITGVTQVEKRFSADADTNLPGNPTLHVYALDDRSTMDQPDLRSGRFQQSGGGAVLDEEFAKANGLKIGDHISIRLNQTWVRLPIEGLALSSEQIFAVKNSATLLPDPKDYGFIVIHTGVLESFYGRKVYNQISVKTAAGADAGAIEKQADALIGNDLIGIVARDDSMSANSVNSRIQQFRTLAVVFPAIFFLITALVTQSTMMRLVENQRGQIGLLKALGYSRRSILWHYTSYGTVVGLSGIVLGLFIGPNVFGRILVPRVKLTFSDYRLSIHWSHFLFAALLILLCTSGISYYSCRKLQGDTPAVLLRDKPPKKGSHIFLESMPELWRKMKFSSKLIARNTLKNKSRLIMSMIGVMGCTGAIVGALTIRSMVSGIAGQMYQNTFTYDQKILLDTSKTNSRYLSSLNLNGVTQQTEETAVEIVCPDGERQMETVTVTPRESPLIRLEDDSGSAVTLTDDGVAVTRKLAKTLGVEAGGSLQFKRTDKSYVSVPVRQVIYIASGQGIYMTDTCWKSLGETFQPTALLVKWNGKPDQRFLSSDTVEDAVTRQSQYAGLVSNLQVMNIAVAMMIFMGSILAFVVLYNSGILNYSERVRDLATLRVLGFHQEEIRNLVLLENYFSVFLGLICGVPTGWLIAHVVAMNMDQRMDLTATILPQNVLVAGILTLIFAWIINSVVARKMKKLDMLSALKSVE